MVDVISNIISDKQQIKNQLGDLPDTVTVPKFYEDVYDVQFIAAKLTRTQIAGAKIWGNSDFGVWGTDSWGDSSGGSFILNNPEFGVLGKNKLGAGGSSSELYAVIPRNNIFVEYFGQTDYIDTTASTGTLDTSAETYTLAVGEILQTEVIAKLRVPITQVKLLSHEEIGQTVGDGMFLGTLSLGVSTFLDDNVKVEFSNDGGTTWENYNVTEGNYYTFTTSAATDELKMRITAEEALTISKPVYIQVN